MPTTTPQSRRGRNFVIAGAVVVLLVVVVAVVALTSHTKKSAPPTVSPTVALCTALRDITAFDKAQPAAHTYPLLKASLVYAHQRFVSVTTPPSAVDAQVRIATTTSAEMIHDVVMAMDKDKITKAQELRQGNQILQWRKANSALATWQKTNCAS